MTPIKNALRRAEIMAFLDSIGAGNADVNLANLALTHSSHAAEQGVEEDNERLEFLGDALLGFLISQYLYDKYPDADEGALTKRKARIVSRLLLGREAETLALDKYLLKGRGLENLSARSRVKILGSALEALIGAIYLSTDLEYTSAFVHRHVFEPGEKHISRDLFADYKSRLQIVVQRRFQTVPEYRVLHEVGPDHDKKFQVEVLVEGLRRGVGSGHRIKMAENEAARQALEDIEGSTGEVDDE